MDVKKSESCVQLVGIYINTATMENNMDDP